jgi:FkbM family methyltransferase
MNQDERLGSLVQIYKQYFGDTAETVWDCGTRDGDDAEYLGIALKASRVIAIDANPIAIQATKAKYPNFEVIHTAITNYDGQTSFDIIRSDRKDYAGSSSIIRTQNFPDSDYSKAFVSATRMDTLIKSLEPVTLDLLKVDLEGFSYEFLEGMGEYLSEAKVLHLETETFARHPGHKNANQVAEMMLQAGFWLAEKSYEWGPSIEDQVWVNGRLAVN